MKISVNKAVIVNIQIEDAEIGDIRKAFDSLSEFLSKESPGSDEIFRKIKPILEFGKKIEVVMKGIEEET